MNQNKVSKIVQSYYIFSSLFLCVGWSIFFATIFSSCMWTHGKKYPNGSRERERDRHKEPFHCDSTEYFMYLQMCALLVCYFLWLTVPTIIITFHSAYTTFTRCEFFSLFFVSLLFIHICRFIDMCETFHWVLVLIYSRFKFYGSKMIRWRNFLLSSLYFIRFDFVWEKIYLSSISLKFFEKERKIKQKIIIKKAKLL